ncbi:hypothetical protein F441_06272 [Phytophthora nicotianae CJ01A1]|uniref:Uncharacterized protein n=6 Tax=Phytophthora nicotianae TaxID=4792 RepID=W2RCR1_PHYN3|nr:hypothetical protein PPTG_20929 [Phytophthora nicotianae INRA-310]ETI50099.1 hypothetical protein F443_06268 [Phytophthora nicotianae P1569]ETK89998.1 hypothetical protein L915_06144 [Phytophthora nicotianae]ETO78839.1 hypothetical protein F444_06329 [Phytophthora nicotianae P1976]ETP19860.1 hypothetical protein F441_06272 [Phytophthora nicotianae CJ01A1]ETP47808.1 hypothetical protein F442_06310 [Phytophthora nicotianae P10297]
MNTSTESFVDLLNEINDGGARHMTEITEDEGTIDDKIEASVDIMDTTRELAQTLSPWCRRQ